MSSESATSIPPRPLRLRILHINDVYELDNFPSLKTLIDEQSNASEADSSDALCVILGGDFLGPSLLSSIDAGASMVDCMDAAGITHVCFGNHECDVPADALARRIHQSEFIWINSNMQDAQDKISNFGETPEYDILTVSNGRITKQVALLGLLTNDPALYRPGSFNGARIEPIIPATERLLPIVEPISDLIIPITHQSMEHDRLFAKHFTGQQFPIILGGHDHVPFNEEVSGSRIFKTGYDAIHAGIVDIVWTESSKAPIISLKMVATKQSSPDPALLRRVQGHKQILEQLEKARLFRIQNWINPQKLLDCGIVNEGILVGKENDDHNHGPEVSFCTANNRLGPSTGTSAIATMLQKGMRCDCCLINGGSVRANRVYPSGHIFFSWKDLKEELTFNTYMTVTALPGHVIQDIITHSRQGMWHEPPIARGGFIHHCFNISYNTETREIDSILGEPLDPDRDYLVAHPIEFLDGIDNHKPLLDWVAEQKTLQSEENRINVVLHQEAARPAKLVIVELFSALLWLELGSFHDLDSNHDGYITRDEIRKKCAEFFDCEEIVDLVVENVFSVADPNQDDKISPLEMMCVHFVATDLNCHVTTEQEFEALRETAAHVLGLDPQSPKVLEMAQKAHQRLDVFNDGRVTRNESIKTLGELRRRSLL